jgi:tryptophan-rich sensory protein
MAQKKKTNLKTYLFVITIVSTFSFTLLAIEEQQTTLTLISVVFGVSTIIFGLYNVLNIKEKK